MTGAGWPARWPAAAAGGRPGEREVTATANPDVRVALAKLTLSLHVTGARPDGYHLLDAEMVTVDLADTLYFLPGQGLEVVDAGAGGRGSGLVPAGRPNLVLRALELVGRQAHVRLVKRIPVGGGLGGGSADAAAVLRWAGWGSPGGARALDAGTQLAEAARLGADVPFCLAGLGRARVRGIGEQVSPLPFEEVEGQAYTLLVPPFGVPTAAVYRAWDDMGGPVGEGPTTWSRPPSKWSRGWPSGVTAWATPRGSSPSWPAAARPGSFPENTRGTGSWSCT